MGLSNDLISQFVKITKDTSKSKKETTVYGKIVNSVEEISENLAKSPFAFRTKI